MGKYMTKEVEDLLNKGHFRFYAKFTWQESSDGDAKARFNRYKEFAKGTGIDQETLQGYYVGSKGDIYKRTFVIIGLHNPIPAHSRWGLEKFCSALIFGTGIKATFGHPVEAAELEYVHGTHG